MLKTATSAVDISQTKRLKFQNYRHETTDDEDDAYTHTYVRQPKTKTKNK